MPSKKPKLITEKPEIPDIDMGKWVDKLVFKPHRQSVSIDRTSKAVICMNCRKPCLDEQYARYDYCSERCDAIGADRADRVQQGDY